MLRFAHGNSTLPAKCTRVGQVAPAWTCNLCTSALARSAQCSSSVNGATRQCKIVWHHASTPQPPLSPLSPLWHRIASRRIASLGQHHRLSRVSSPPAFPEQLRQGHINLSLRTLLTQPGSGQIQQHRPLVITRVLQSKRPTLRSICPSGPNLIRRTKATAAVVSARLPFPLPHPPSLSLAPLSSRTKPRSLGAYIYIQKPFVLCTHVQGKPSPCRDYPTCSLRGASCCWPA